MKNTTEENKRILSREEHISKACFDGIKTRLPRGGVHHNGTPGHVSVIIENAFANQTGCYVGLNDPDVDAFIKEFMAG